MGEKPSAKITKKVRMKLVGLNGNAFNVMGQFAANAREQGWSKSEIDAVLTEAMSSDYDHLLRTIAANVTETRR